MKLVTTAQMRELERKAVEAGTPVDELMEAAGLAVAQEAWLTLGVVAGRRVLVLVGPGNNGGDGLVAARHLADWGGDVVVYMLKARAVSDANLAKVRERGVPVFVAEEDHGYRQLDEAIDQAEMVIDALLGTSRSRPIEGALAEILRRLQRASGRPNPACVIAVDLPTGVDADSGRADPLAVRADMTVTLGVAKVGLYTLPGSELAGRVQVVDIGLPKDAAQAVPLDMLSSAWVRSRLPPRPKGGNKGTFGRVLVVAGSRNYVGAARLAAAACYRAGAGLVTIACPPDVQAMIASALAEATYLPLGQEPVPAIADGLRAYDVLLIGPGLTQSPGARRLVTDVLAAVPDNVRGCVIDADALNALAQTTGWHDPLHAPAVLTPHPGEMARLRGATVAQVQEDRLHAALAAAAEWRHVVVLKGAHTVVAAPDGRAAISPHANPLLATAGTGDVLAGVVAGLIAQGADPFDAAGCGVYLHGLAAEEIGEELGDRGMLAGDLLGALPRVIRTVREGRLSRSLPPSPIVPDLPGAGSAAFGGFPPA